MTSNEGSMDRATRMIVGIGLMALGLSGTVVGTMGTVVGVVGVLALASGTTGVCPIYRIFGWDTLRPHG